MNILFDLDGTLTDSRPGIVACIQHALVSLQQSVPSESELQRFIGPPLRDAFVELLPPGSDQVDVAVAKYRERFVAVGMFENSVYDGIHAVLDALAARKLSLFVATSKPRVFAERILEHFDLRKYFRTVYGSELTGELTDKGELIAHVLKAGELPPAETVMIGDRYHDIRGALKNGVAPIGVLWGYGSHEELVAAGAKTLVDRPRDLVRLWE